MHVAAKIAVGLGVVAAGGVAVTVLGKRSATERETGVDGEAGHTYESVVSPFIKSFDANADGKLSVKTETVTFGNNTAMGDTYSSLTPLIAAADAVLGNRDGFADLSELTAIARQYDQTPDDGRMSSREAKLFQDDYGVRWGFGHDVGERTPAV